ncbi:hypothetical protein VE01_04023 [Pseudogymnoascus verrucosus]|uniref:Uncharacterized protein n=1 Tax=Pseudogymnoascus verrucosus TaxID=342668 RepID=A0A1B8GQA1_9PEZI|nr:uncharacterized protein VE01_04023 [Pseudogymnoascus verrucosus]OBT98023.1 hypothetical protein VE01_04023 [Pseudogymnoascus verrucosus]
MSSKDSAIEDALQDAIKTAVESGMDPGKIQSITTLGTTSAAAGVFKNASEKAIEYGLKPEELVRIASEVASKYQNQPSNQIVYTKGSASKMFKMRLATKKTTQEPAQKKARVDTRRSDSSDCELRLFDDTEDD